MEWPQVFAYESSADEGESGAGLAQQLMAFGIGVPFVVSSIHGDILASALSAASPRVTPPREADQRWASELGSVIHRSGADAVVAIGGGRVLDVAKLAAARAGLVVVAVPTQLSHDGICSPVAVVPDESGASESLGAVAPRLVYLSLPTLLGAPVASVRAGIGDLLANPLALRDWALATERGLASADQRAWDLSVESFEAVKAHLDDDLGRLASDREFLRKLADALVLSGMSMICAGNSRPASGGEHEISHAIEELFGTRALHGAQVAFGCIFSVALYGEDTNAFRARLKRLGLPQDPRQLGLSRDDVVDVLLKAPETRPGRYTILEHADLDEKGAAALVERIWPR